MENEMETTIISWVNIGINGKIETIIIRFPKPKIQLPSTHSQTVGASVPDWKALSRSFTALPRNSEVLFIPRSLPLSFFSSRFERRFQERLGFGNLPSEFNVQASCS